MASPLDLALADLLTEMRDLLPLPLPPPHQEPNVSLASVSEQALAVGNWRGNETRGALAGVALKGGRLNAVVRFQLWGDQPTDVDTATNELHGRLLTAKPHLRQHGFLRINAENTLSAEPLFVSNVNAWRKTTDYRVLYEYYFEDTDGASSLISTIPATINDQFGESMTITDDMIRWDTTATPGLVVQGPFKLGGLTALAFISGSVPSGTVTLTRTFDTAAGLPAMHPTLASFLTAVAGQNPTERHARVVFPTISDFLGVFTSVGDPVEMGDLNADGVLDKYSPMTLPLDGGVHLTTAADRFEITFQNPVFDQLAVLYVRATG